MGYIFYISVWFLYIRTSESERKMLFLGGFIFAFVLHL